MSVSRLRGMPDCVGQGLRRVEHPLAAERGAEGVDAQLLRQVVPWVACTSSTAWAGFAMPVADRAGVERQARG